MWLRYQDISSYTQMNHAALEVLATPEYSAARDEFNADDWRAVTGIVAPYYNLILADTGKSLHHSLTRAALSTLSSVVIVCSATADGAPRGCGDDELVDHNGYHHHARR